MLLDPYAVETSTLYVDAWERRVPLRPYGYAEVPRDSDKEHLVDQLHDAFRVHLFVSEDEAGEVEGSFIEMGIRGRKLQAHGSAPLAEVLFAGSASLTAVGHLVVALRRCFKRGIVVDALSGDSITIKSDRSIPRGMVIIRSQDGTVEVRDAEGIGQALIGAVTNAAARGGESRTESVAPSRSGDPSA